MLRKDYWVGELSDLCFGTFAIGILFDDCLTDCYFLSTLDEKAPSCGIYYSYWLSVRPIDWRDAADRRIPFLVGTMAEPRLEMALLEVGGLFVTKSDPLFEEASGIEIEGYLYWSSSSLLSHAITLIPSADKTPAFMSLFEVTLSWLVTYWKVELSIAFC